MKHLAPIILSLAVSGCVSTTQNPNPSEYIQSADKHLAERIDTDSSVEELDNQARFNSKLQSSGSSYTVSPNSPGYVTKQAKLTTTVAPQMPPLEQVSLPVTVKLGCVVDRDGKVTEIYVVDSTDSGFNFAAMEALTKWKFQPAESNGKAVPVGVVVPVVFK